VIDDHVDILLTVMVCIVDSEQVARQSVSRIVGTWLVDDVVLVGLHTE